MITFDKPSNVVSKFKILVYGNPKAGKTTFAGSASQVESMQNIFFIQVGTNEGRSLHVFGDEHIQIFTPTDYEDLKVFKDFLQDHSRAKNDQQRIAIFRKHFKTTEEIEKANGLRPEMEYKTIVVDSIDALQSLVRNSITEKTDFVDLKKNKTMIQKDWGTLLDSVDVFISNILKMEYHVILTAHEVEERVDAELVKRPYLQGAYRNKITGEVNTYCYLKSGLTKDEKTGKAKFFNELISANIAGVQGGDGTGILPPILKNPNMKKINILLDKKLKGDDVK